MPLKPQDHAPLRKPYKDWNRCISHCPQHLIQKPDREPKIYDTVIIGGGPAGITAAIYTCRRGLSTLLLTGSIGGQMRQSADIQNWTGTIHATGQELTNVFLEHITALDQAQSEFPLWIQKGVFATSITKTQGVFVITLQGGMIVQSKTVIIACGKKPRTLGLAGEQEAIQTKTLSFSATSDAPLHKDKSVLIIGGGNSALDIALQLTHYTDQITIATNKSSLSGEGCLREKVLHNDAITTLYNTDTNALLLHDDNTIKGVMMQHSGNEDYRPIMVDSVFYAIGQTPNTMWLRDFITLNKYHEIVVDKRCRTTIEGCFAGGDCTDQPHKQIIVAAGEGAICALECHEYIQHT